MLIDTTHIGPVGEPTPMKIANDVSAGKQTGSLSHFDSRCDRGDDFDDMAVRGLHLNTADRLRRIAHGLAGIREIAKILSVFDTERQLQTSEESRALVLSPRASEGILRGAEVLADFLNQEVYALGIDLTRRGTESFQ